MNLDVPTLMIAGALVAAMSGASLLVVRFQYRETDAIVWWAAANFMLAFGMLMLARDSADRTFAASVFTLLTVNPALVFIGARRFDQHPAPFALAAIGALLPLALGMLGVFPLDADPYFRASHVVQVAISAAFYLAAAGSLVLQPADRLRARLPLAGLCTLHAVALSLTTADRFAGPPGRMDAFGALYPWLHLEVLVFFVGSTLFLVAAMRERSERSHRQAADTDGLTGLLNRRGFFDRGERMLERARISGAPCAAIVFDLDRFKAINDAHGHAFGDRALLLFADTANKQLRPEDLIGRLGGEEFAVLLPGADADVGSAVGDRIRAAFAEATRRLGDGDVVGTLSGGVAPLDEGESLDQLLRRADAALYRAKQAGRDRIECEPGRGPGLRIVRIA